MTHIHQTKIGIIGAGYSGSMLAHHLVNKSKLPFKVKVFNRDKPYGLGMAYSTPFPFHLLNVPAQKMSAFGSKPDDFVHFLNHQDLSPYPGPFSSGVEQAFAPRQLYGQYLQQILNTPVSKGSTATLTTCKQSIVDIEPTNEGYTLYDEVNQAHPVNVLIFALGNLAPKPICIEGDPDCPFIHNNPWEWNILSKLPSKAPIAFLGTGLTMIDYVLCLYHQNHQGPIYALSRHGRLPLPHERSVGISLPWQLIEGKDLAGLRKVIIAEHIHKRQIPWRSVIDALRPYTQDIWQQFTLQDKTRFLRHLKPLWEVHRHRIAPQIHQLLQSLIQKGQLRILSSQHIRYHLHRDHLEIQFKNKKTHQQESLQTQGLVNCTGPNTDLQHASDPLLTACFNKGILQQDPLQLGVEVNEQFQILAPNGQPRLNTYALGPMCKAKFWEITAVPDLRKQTEHLAEIILNQEESYQINKGLLNKQIL